MIKLLRVLRDIYTSFRKYRFQVFLKDKNQDEELKNGSDLILGYLPNLKKIVYLETKNMRLNKEDLIRLVDSCVQNCSETNCLINETIERVFVEKAELQTFE